MDCGRRRCCSRIDGHRFSKQAQAHPTPHLDVDSAAARPASELMKPTNNTVDYALYGAIGGLTAALGYVASGDLPHFMLPPCGIALAVLIAIKAKRSQDNPPSTVTSIKVEGK